MIGVLSGSLLFVLGWRHLKILAFPLAFLLLMIPVPAILFNQVAFPLQLFASRGAELVLTALAIPVLREGNVINLASMPLEVAEACSGIRSLVSLFTLALIYGYFTEKRAWGRIALAGAASSVRVLCRWIGGGASGWARRRPCRRA